jgi:acetyl-CoA carboxylase carboxyl transferase subunit alpha
MVAAIVGEGGSGGAVALASAERVLMFEHAVYSVISPEGCASILWRTAEKAAEAAEAMRMTAQDLLDLIPDPYFGPAFHDQPILALGKVRYIGEPVAAVLASDPHVAEEAAALIEVHYEELPAVFDEVQAMSSDALVHE